MPLNMITAPANEPISLAEAKLHLRVTGTDRDALITMLISAARRKAENITKTALITQTWEQSLDCFPYIIKLEKAPLQSIVSIKYFDIYGIEQTLDPSIYQVDIKSMPGQVAPSYGQAWPSVRQEKFNPITIKYICGFGNNDTDVPATIRQWMLVRIADLFENPQASIVNGNVAELPYSYIDGLLDCDTIWGC